VKASDPLAGQPRLPDKVCGSAIPLSHGATNPAHAAPQREVFEGETCRVGVSSGDPRSASRSGLGDRELHEL
jgi:hypothetical protein